MPSILKLSSQTIRLSGLMGQLGVRRFSTPTNMAIFDVETLEDFERMVKKSVRPVIVDFHATWCSPCKQLQSRIANIVSEKRGAISVARVDIDEHGELALNYNVGAVPSLLVMKDGKVLNRMVGLQSTDVIRAWINQVVKGKPVEKPSEEEGDDE